MLTWPVLLFLAFLFGLLASLAIANIGYERERRRMTPEERRIDDERISEEIQLW